MRHSFLRMLPLALVGVLAAGGIAYGLAGGGGGSTALVACAKNETGQLRLVDDASQCLRTEHAVAFQAALGSGLTQFTVDCSAGQRIGDVLESVRVGTVPVSIDVEGTCTEEVQIDRDHVTLNAASPGAGITAPSTDADAL
ncbi:MAG: hypothetical protein ACXVZ4_00260 [Gaiellaceae bacterium]